MDVFTVVPGNSPIVLAQPHGGTFVPDDIAPRLNERGRGLDDCDWHINRLYDGLLPDATIVSSNVHRYAVDANRDPGGASLYPGQFTTGLCPTTDFDGNRIWQDGQEPSADEIESRRLAYHAPYHAALADELARVKALHGCVILFDCHSIRSHIPALFEGELPIFNIGTNNGETCAPVIEATVAQSCHKAAPDQTVLNGRFKGGWTTRHYGRPDQGQHAIQMELAQRAYMNEQPPWDYRDDLAQSPRAAFRHMLEQLETLARSGQLTPPEGTAHE